MERFDQKYEEYIFNHPLFRGIEKTEKQDIHMLCKEKKFKKSETILKGGELEEGLHLLLAGNAEVYVTGHSEDRFEILEVIQPGELIGLSRLSEFLGESTVESFHYYVGVRAMDDVITFYIPYQVLEKRWEIEAVRDYILRKVTVRLKHVYSSLAEQVRLARQWGESDPFIRRVQDLMTSPVIFVNSTATIQETAQLMRLHSVGSILIVDDQQLKGIITESDLVNRVISNSLSYHEHISEIMTKNPYTVSRYDYYYQALSEFLLRGVKHLPVIDQNQVVGIISLSDLLRKKNYSMVNTLQKIDKADKNNLLEARQSIYEVLGTLLQSRAPILYTLELMTHLYDRLSKHVIELAIQSLEAKEKGKPPVPFAWYQMGSAGRGEQFLLTDQDHFLVYDNVEEKDQKVVKEYFSWLGQEIVDLMEKSGYKRCQGKMMASEENWRGTILLWQERLRNWSVRATNDALLLAQNFLSFRFVYGSKDINDRFIEMLEEHFKSTGIFLYRLALVEQEHQVPILEQPVRSLFGLDKKQLDLKKETLFPFHHALQIISINQGIIEGMPLEKIRRLHEKKFFSDKFTEDLIDAFEKTMKIYVSHKWSQYAREEEPISIVQFTHLSSSEKEDLIQVQKVFRSLQIQMLSEFSL